MRRTLAAACLLLVLLGCTARPMPSGGTPFYYPRREYFHANGQSVLSPELRDMSGHEEDVAYVLNMYLLGPLEDGLTLYFPKETQLLSWEQTPEATVLTLSDDTGQMEEIQFTLACAGLAKTTMELWGFNCVCITRGYQSMTLAPQDLVLLDEQTEPNGGTP